MGTTDTCRWCHGTGWAEIPDHDMGDIYWVPCPGGCPVPNEQSVADVPEVPF